MKSIVVATDGSSGSRHAAEQAIALARGLGAKVTFLSVIREVSFSTDPVSGEAVGHPGDRAAQAAVNAAVANAKAAGVEADFHYLGGNPAEAVLDFAREHAADLVVVGSRGLGSVRGLLLGSVSRAIVDQADRPVLVVKEPRAEGS